MKRREDWDALANAAEGSDRKTRSAARQTVNVTIMAEPDINLETVGQLLALIAHDLRNPLSALHSNIGFLASVLQSQDEDVADALSDGMVSCDGLSHIIDNIDLFGQALRHAQSPARTAVDALGLLREVVERCEPVAVSHGIHIAAELPPGAEGLEVLGARELLAKSLSNLIRNCIQHAPPQSQVSVKTRIVEERLEVLVLDCGVPLDDELWGCVFTAEGQVAAKASSMGRYSRGMGLFAARLAANAGGGGVGVVPAPEGFNNALKLSLEIHRE